MLKITGFISKFYYMTTLDPKNLYSPKRIVKSKIKSEGQECNLK